MKNKKFASFLAAAAALVLLAMPAFAADEQTELPAGGVARSAEVLNTAPDICSIFSILISGW